MTITIKTTGEQINVDLDLTRSEEREIQNKVDDAINIDPYRTTVMIVTDIRQGMWSRTVKIVLDLINATGSIYNVKKNRRNSLI